MTVRDHNEPFGAGFERGVQFRTFYEFSIAAGASVYIQHIAPTEFYVIKQEMTVDAGGIKLHIYNAATQATAFTNPLIISGMNRTTQRPAPYYTVQSTLATGGTITGGTVVDLARVIASNATAQQTSIGGGTSQPRALPAGTYHQRLENISNQTATGVYYIDWEEILP